MKYLMILLLTVLVGACKDHSNVENVGVQYVSNYGSVLDGNSVESKSNTSYHHRGNRVMLAYGFIGNFYNEGAVGEVSVFVEVQRGIVENGSVSEYETVDYIDFGDHQYTNEFKIGKSGFYEVFDLIDGKEYDYKIKVVFQDSGVLVSEENKRSLFARVGMVEEVL